MDNNEPVKLEIFDSLRKYFELYESLCNLSVDVDYTKCISNNQSTKAFKELLSEVDNFDTYFISFINILKKYDILLTQNTIISLLQKDWDSLSEEKDKNTKINEFIKLLNNDKYIEIGFSTNETIKNDIYIILENLVDDNKIITTFANKYFEMPYKCGQNCNNVNTLIKQLVDGNINSLDKKLFDKYFNIISEKPCYSVVPKIDVLRNFLLKCGDTLKKKTDPEKINEAIKYSRINLKKNNDNTLLISELFPPKYAKMLNDALQYGNTSPDLSKKSIKIDESKNTEKIFSDEDSVDGTTPITSYEPDEKLISAIIDYVTNYKIPNEIKKQEEYKIEEEDALNPEFENVIKANEWKYKDNKFYKAKSSNPYKWIESDKNYIEKDIKGNPCERLCLFTDKKECIEFFQKIIDPNSDLSSLKELIISKDFNFNIDCLKKNINDIHPSIIITVLKKFGFEKYIFNDELGNKIVRIENYNTWLERFENKIDEEIRGKILQGNTAEKFFKILIHYFNKNFYILNKGDPKITPRVTGLVLGENLKKLRFELPKSKLINNSEPVVNWDELRSNLKKTYGSFYRGFDASNLKNLPKEIDPSNLLSYVYSLAGVVPPQLSNIPHSYTQGSVGFLGGADLEPIVTSEPIMEKKIAPPVPQLSLNITKIYKDLENSIKQNNKSLDNDIKKSIEDKIQKFADLEKDLYKELLKIIEYSKLIKIIGDSKKETVALSAMDAAIKKYTLLANKYDKNHFGLLNVLNSIKKHFNIDDNIPPRYESL